MIDSNITQKLWNYCHALLADGMHFSDYVEQFTYLLFLKMANERTQAPHKQTGIVPEKWSLQKLLKQDGAELFYHDRHTREAPGDEKDMLGLIFNRSQSKFYDPAKLRRLIVELIDKENWSTISADVKGDAYERLLEKNAQDTKSSARQATASKA